MTLLLYMYNSITMFTNYACMPNYPVKHPAGKFAPPPGTDPNFFNPVQIGLKDEKKVKN